MSPVAPQHRTACCWSWSLMCCCSAMIWICAEIHPLTTCCHFTSKVIRSIRPKQIHVLLSKSLRHSLSFTSEPVCFSLPLPGSTKDSSLSHSDDWYLVFPFELTDIFLLFPVRCFLVECVSHSLPPLLSIKQPLMYAEPQRIKLKAHNYPSERSGDSDPVSAQDKHVNQTTRGGTTRHWSQQIRTGSAKLGLLWPAQAFNRLTSLSFVHLPGFCTHWLSSLSPPLPVTILICLFTKQDLITGQ